MPRWLGPPVPGGVWVLSREEGVLAKCTLCSFCRVVGTEAWGGRGTGPGPAGHLHPLAAPTLVWWGPRLLWCRPQTRPWYFWSAGVWALVEKQP